MRCCVPNLRLTPPRKVERGVLSRHGLVARAHDRTVRAHPSRYDTVVGTPEAPRRCRLGTFPLLRLAAFSEPLHTLFDDDGRELTRTRGHLVVPQLFRELLQFLPDLGFESNQSLPIPRGVAWAPASRQNAALSLFAESQQVQRPFVRTC